MCVTKATTLILLQQCDQHTVNTGALALATDNRTTGFCRNAKQLSLKYWFWQMEKF